MSHVSYIVFMLMLSCTSCGSSLFTDALNTVDDIETDECVSVKVYRDAFKKNKALKINVDINSDSP